MKARAMQTFVRNNYYRGTEVHRLAIALYTGAPLIHDNKALIREKLKVGRDEAANYCDGAISTNSNVFKFEGQIITVIFNFLHGSLSWLAIIPNKIKVGHDLDKGIEWLKYGSSNGDKACSFHLAKYYAGASSP